MLEWMVVPSRLSSLCSRTVMNAYKSPAGPLFLPALPSDLTRSRLLVSTPAVDSEPQL